MSEDSLKDTYKDLFMANRDAIMTLEPPHWRFTSGNPAAIHMFRAKDEQDFLSHEPWKLSPETQPDGQPSGEKAKAMIENAMQEGSNFFEWTHRRANGEDFFAEVLLSKVESRRGDFLHATVREITERKKLEEEVLRSQKEQQMIIDSIPAWVFYKDDKNMFIRVNKAFAEVMQKSREELEGVSCDVLFPKEQAEAYLKDDREVIASGVPKKNIIESMNSPHGTLWLQTDKIPYKNDEGIIIGVIGFTIDITLRKEAEDKTKKHEQELERFNELMIGRELEMVELKKEILRLKNIAMH